VATSKRTTKPKAQAKAKGRHCAAPKAKAVTKPKDKAQTEPAALQEGTYRSKEGQVMRESTMRMVRRANELYWQSLTWTDIAEKLNAEALTRRTAKTLRDIPSEYKEYWEHLNEERKETTIANTERNAIITMADLCSYRSPLCIEDSKEREELETALEMADDKDRAGLLIALNKEHRADAYVRLRTASVAMTRIRGLLGVSLTENNYTFNFTEEEIERETKQVGDALLTLGEEMAAFAKGGNGKDEFVN